MLRTISHFGLLEAFVALVTALFLVLTAFDYLQTEQTGKKQAEAVLAQTERTVTVEVQQLVTATATLLHQLEEGHRQGSVNFLRPQSVNRLVMPVLRQYPPLTAVKQGDPEGNAYFLYRNGATWKNRLHSSTRPGIDSWLTLDAQGKEVARAEVDDLYDPRQRPWYHLASHDGAVTWSPPYLQRNTHSIGIAAVKSLGPGKGVVGVNLELKDLSTFLAGSSSHWAGAKVVITDLQGRVLATSEKQPSARLAHLTAPPSLHDPPFVTERMAAEATRASGRPFQRLETAGGVVFSRVSDTMLAPGAALRIILTVPGSVFTGSFAADLAWKAAAYLVLLLSASLLYLRRYIFPLRALVRLMKGCDFSKPRPFPATARLDEVGMLYRHLNQMTSNLVDARDFLDSVLNAVGDPIIVKDSAHRFVLVNDAACALFGHRREEILGRSDHEIFPAQQADVFVKIDLLVLESGESNQNEEAITGAGGELRTIVTRKTRYRDPSGNRFVVAVIRDITELREAQGKVVESARQAGMAEIAVNVLHNVGNVLNSVAVSTGQVMQMVRASKAPGLARAVELLEANADRLGHFFSEDHRGRLMPGYLGKLSEALKGERAAALEELERLHKNVEHIGDVIATQQRYAGASGLIQPIRVRDLLEDALHINEESIRVHGVTVLREMDEVPHLPLDRARVLVILVNLIKNAVYAMAKGGAPSRRTLRLRVEFLPEEAEGALRITVADDGEGIPAQHLTRIFAHGFTTKGKGQGFGLHGCALAAQEMGGTLSASSEGTGKGAAFTLQIPVQGA